MTSLQDIAAIQQAEGPTYFDDPDKDRLLKLLLSVAEENCVLRDRLLTAQALSSAVTDAAIDAYEVSEADIEARMARHNIFYEKLMVDMVQILKEA